MFQNALNRHWAYVYFTYDVFCFHVSFLVSMFHSKNTEGEKQKHCGSDIKTLWERFKNTEGALSRSLSVLKNET